MANENPIDGWLTVLRTIFEKEPALDPEMFDLYAQLRDQGVEVHKTVQEPYRNLQPADKEIVLRELWQLAYIAEKTAEEQREIFRKIAQRYERFFHWEEDEDPGWLL